MSSFFNEVAHTSEAKGAFPFVIQTPLFQLAAQLQLDIGEEATKQLIKTKAKLPYPKVWMEIELTEAKIAITFSQNSNDPNGLLDWQTHAKLKEGFEDKLHLVQDMGLRIAGNFLVILAILNDTKLVTKEKKRVDEALQKARQRRGKLPLHEVTILSVPLPMQRYLAESKEGGKYHNRLHWQRGHFKHRATGVFWWNPHLRGKAEGFLEKQYEITVH